jgi:4-nitrophenyl phosphatase
MLREKELFIFDMDGVVYRTNDPIISAINTIKELRQRGKKVVFQTNNATRTPEQFAEKLAKMDLNTDPTEIYTTPIIAANYLAPLYPQKIVYVIGENGIIMALKAKGFQILNELHPEIETVEKIPPGIYADIVLVGLDTAATYKKLRTAVMLINNGAHFYATNSDANFPASGALWPGAGAMVSFISTAILGHPKKDFGKPHPDGLETILNQYKIVKEKAVVIGDRLDTDILGGNRAGITTLLVETGINNRSDLVSRPLDQQPSYIVKDLTEMMQEYY